MEFSVGNVKITYYYDDGNLYRMTNDILSITGEKKIIVIEHIENTGSRFPYGQVQAAMNALNAFKKLNTDNSVITARVYIPEENRKGLNDMEIAREYEIKSILLDQLGFYNIGTLYDYNPNDIRVFVLPDGKGKLVIDYCTAKDYMTVTDNSLLPICRYHVDGLIKSGHISSGDPAVLATELNDIVEKAIHEFNVAHAHGPAQKRLSTTRPISRRNSDDN